MIQVLLKDKDSKRPATVNCAAKVVVGCTESTRAQEPKDATGSDLCARCS